MQKRAYFFPLLLPGVLAACRASDSTTDRAESAVQKTTPEKAPMDSGVSSRLAREVQRAPTDSGASNPRAQEGQADAHAAKVDTGAESDAGTRFDRPDPGFAPARLPSVECEEAPWDKSIPALCDWASSVDTVFRAEILSIDAITTDFEIALGPRQGQVQDNCDEGIASGYALLLHLWNWETLSGDAPLGKIDVRVGPLQVVEWHPAYQGDSPQDMKWRFATNDDGPQPLLPGTVVGVAATRTADGSIWSLFLAPLFTFSSEGVVVLPEKVESCLAGIAPKLPDLGGTLVSELRRALRKCGPPDGDLRAERTARFPEPSYSYASRCLLPIDGEK